MSEKELLQKIRTAQYFRRLAIANNDEPEARKITAKIERWVREYQEQFVYVPTRKARRS